MQWILSRPRERAELAFQPAEVLRLSLPIVHIRCIALQFQLHQPVMYLHYPVAGLSRVFQLHFPSQLAW